MTCFDPHWWKRLFDETYLLTDARSVCDDNLTCREVNFLERTLKLEKSCAILDLCGGQGRHSLELSRRGYQDVTVLDYSRFLVEVGIATAQKEDLNTRFIRNDARDTGLPDRSYGAIIVMASSFGYFVDESDDEQILHEAYRLLKPEGALFLDLPNQEHLLKNFSHQSWHEANEEILVCRQRRVDDDIVYTREVVISKMKGLIRDEIYSTRIYSPKKITRLLKSAGFSAVDVQENFVAHTRKQDYGCMTNRMIVVALKD
jgi:D-alanine-D-alanine ligase